MTDAAGTRTKLHQTTDHRPPLRLLSQEWEDSPNRYLLVEEKSNGSWDRMGSVELGYGPVDTRGVFDSGAIAEWSTTRYHANGDRVVVSRRLRTTVNRHVVSVTLEEKREQVLGYDTRDEHDWQETEQWTVEAPQLTTGDSHA